MSRWRVAGLVALGLAVLLGALPCHAEGGRPRAGHTRTAAAPTPSTVHYLPGRSGGQVNVLTFWSGPDLESFRAVLAPFIRQSGVNVSLESTPDVAAILAMRVEAGAAPDIAVLPGGALVQQYAQAGRLVPLASALDLARLREQYLPGWLEQASVQGQVYGLPYRTVNKSIVWYNPHQFQSRHWRVPLTWQEMLDLGDGIADLGLTPWSLGLRDPADDGRAGAEWIENILLRASGAEVYDRWLRHEIAWTDEAVRQAFLSWGRIVGQPRHVRGGPLRALKTGGSEAIADLYREVPGAYLCLQGSLVQPLLSRDLQGRRMGEDYDFFLLPSMRPAEDAPVLAASDTVVAFRDTPQTRLLLRYLAGEGAQTIWVRRGGFIAPSRSIGLDDYPDPLSRRAARQVLEAATLRFAGAKEMPTAVEQAFRQATLEFVMNPGQLEAILREVERVAAAAYAPEGPTLTKRQPPAPASAPTPGWRIGNLAPPIPSWAPLVAPQP